MKNKNKKVCFIASSGGHLEEVKQLKKVKDVYDSYYIVATSKATQTNEYKYQVSDYNRDNIFLFLFTLIKTTIQQIKIFFKEKPDYIITTGPGMVLPTCIIGKIFKRKIIYIESFARINSPSKTGKIIYKFADMFLIQSEKLKEFYPNAIYGGALF